MNDHEFANSKDGDDNTILDLAIANKQIETIKYLLASAQIDVNAITANTLRALDNILARSGPKDLEIGNSLDEAGGASRGSRDIPVDSSGNENGTNIRQRLLKYCTPFLIQFLNGLVDNGSRGGGEFMKEIRTGLMVVASVICSLTFQIGVNPPGGVWQDNLVVDSQGNPVPNPHKAGEAIMASTSPNEFRFLYKANVMSFGTSMLAMLFLIIPIPLRNNALVVLLFSLMLSTLCTVAVTYSSSIGAITPADLKQLNLLSLSLALTCVLVIPLLTVIGILRLGIWLKSRGLINVSQPETPPSSVDINHASNRNQEDFQNIHDLQ
ncbi:uncharacterized protein LOC132286831 isoform X2 [Cornus florida]|uniref:uncharacterized protein LOC132286831 isoform X2 n=1 Tax=Cornus florida TaxID=4283 RepID=UPI0028A2AB27|nr:uncharacterized protein LOC132286831 isoform X2 [Cornus florida]